MFDARSEIFNHEVFFKHTTFIKSKSKYKLKGFPFPFSTLRDLNTIEY